MTCTLFAVVEACIRAVVGLALLGAKSSQDKDWAQRIGPNRSASINRASLQRKIVSKNHSSMDMTIIELQACLAFRFPRTRQRSGVFCLVYDT